MSAMNHLNNSIDEDMIPGLTEITSESMTIDQINPPSGCMSISTQELTDLSQMVVDERSNYSNEPTNQNMNDMIVDPSRSRRLSILVNEFDIPFGEARRWTNDSTFNYINPDEQSNDRIAYTSDTLEYILIDLLSPEVIRLMFDVIWNSIPLGVQDTRPHAIVLPVNTPRQDFIIVNDENGNINEDATVLNDSDDWINDADMNLTINEIERGNQMILRESLGTETADELTINLNSIVSTDAQDNHYSNIHNQNEQIMGHDNTPDIEHQDNSHTDNNERGQVSPRLVHNDNVTSNIPTASLLSSTAPRTSTTGSSEQAEEIELILAGPTDKNNHTTEDPAHLSDTDPDVSPLNTHHRKQPNLLNAREEIDGEKPNL